MPTERVLIEIVTAANMAGVKEAQAGFLGLTPQVALAGAAIAGLVFVGKSAIENFEAQEKATKDLEQAYATQKDTLAAHKKEIEAFLETNKRFIDDQYDTQAALAAVVRAGHDQTEAMRMLNDALDLSVAKHSSVSEAANMLVLAEAGNSRALRFLGITTAEYNAIMKSTLTDAQKHDALLKLIEPKIKGLRNSTTELHQSQDALNKDWQDFSARIGPAVVYTLKTIVEELDYAVTSIGQMADGIGKVVGAAGGFLQGVPNALMTNPFHLKRRAAGGPTDPFSSYIVGESGPEVLHMGSQGGYVTPGSSGGNGGGGGAHIHVHVDRGAFIDGVSIDRLANAVAQRLSYVTGR